MAAMRILLTGASGYVGSSLLPTLLEDGHEVRGFARDPARVGADIPVVRGDVVTGAGLAQALADIEVAYFLIHSMEPSRDGAFAERERRAAVNFADAARAAGVRRVVYLGGLVPAALRTSPHLASRLAVERILLNSSPEAVALRASIVIGARSRSFRFLVRLVERVPVLPLPGWRDFRTQPIDGRDVVAYLAACATAASVAGLSLDIAGPKVLSYGAMVQRIADLMLVDRPPVRLGLTATPVASRIASAIAGEAPELIRPLMEGLTGDLLPRDDSAQRLLGVPLHSFDAAVERALREWEATEPLRAR
jgi:uncharacterized protein YbjT (DUF2867 family)